MLRFARLAVAAVALASVTLVGSPASAHPSASHTQTQVATQAQVAAQARATAGPTCSQPSYVWGDATSTNFGPGNWCAISNDTECELNFSTQGHLNILYEHEVVWRASGGTAAKVNFYYKGAIRTLDSSGNVLWSSNSGDNNYTGEFFKLTMTDNPCKASLYRIINGQRIWAENPSA